MMDSAKSRDRKGDFEMEEYRKPQALDDENLDKVAGGYDPGDIKWTCRSCGGSWTDKQTDNGRNCPVCGGKVIKHE